MTTDYNISSYCPEITIDNNSTYDVSGSYQEDNFGEYLKIYIEDVLGNVTTLSSLDGSLASGVFTSYTFDAPDLPEVLEVTVVQIPTADTVNPIHVTGDIVYNPADGLLYECVADNVAFAIGPNFIETTEPKSGALYVQKTFLSLCSLSDKFDTNLIDYLSKIDCFDGCCDEMPCDDDLIDATKIMILAADVYFTQGQLGVPVIQTNVFKESFIKNRNIYLRSIGETNNI